MYNVGKTAVKSILVAVVVTVLASFLGIHFGLLGLVEVAVLLIAVIGSAIFVNWRIMRLEDRVEEREESARCYGRKAAKAAVAGKNKKQKRHAACQAEAETERLRYQEARDRYKQDGWRGWVRCMAGLAIFLAVFIAVVLGSVLGAATNGAVKSGNNTPDTTIQHRPSNPDVRDVVQASQRHHCTGSHQVKVAPGATGLQDHCH